MHIEIYGCEDHNLHTEVYPWHTHQDARKERKAAPVESQEVGILHQRQTALAEVGTQLIRQLVRILVANDFLEFLKPWRLLLLCQRIVLVEELEELLQRLPFPLHLLVDSHLLDGIIHLAAESHVDRSIKDPFTFAHTNVMGTLSLLQAAKIYWESLPEGYEGKRFYHISTDEVYGALKMTHPEGIPAPFTTKASSGKNHEAYGEEFFVETTKYNPHSPYSASKASSDHFVRAFHDTYGMPTIVTNCSNNYGPYQFPEKLIPLFINNIRHRKPLPVYGKGENVRDWLYVVDHARAIDMIFHKGKIAETYNIGGFNEWKNIDIIKVVIKTVDRLLGRKEGEDMDLITYVTDRKGHDMRYAIDSRKLQKELGWEPSLQFEEGIEETVKWYLDNQEWMDNVTSGDYQKYYDNMYSNR